MMLDLTSESALPYYVHLITQKRCFDIMFPFNEVGWIHISLHVLVHSFKCDPRHAGRANVCSCRMPTHFSNCTKSAKFHSTITKYY